ncbi:MAG: phage tail protein, partial [Alphaproteobacteria bacterium]|nr:phage tail protein [Alphaproteobacteria bacterium]
IRHALLADRLGQINSPRMTATEVLERSAEISKLLGATFGRLQSELLNPLIERGLAILRRRGEIDDIMLDGRRVDLRYRSPLAKNQQRQDAQDALLWFDTISKIGPEALSVIDAPKAARWLAQAFNVPDALLKPQAQEIKNG